MTKKGRPSLERLLDQLSAEMENLAHLGGLPRTPEAESVWKSILLEEVHNSTALEGNTLALKQVRELLEHDRTVGGKPFREYLEIKGYDKASRWVYEHAIDRREQPDRLITLPEIRHIHELLVTDEWSLTERNASPGGWRTMDIHPFPSGMQPPPHWQIAALMHDYADDAGRGPETLASPIPWVASMHARFERIHPFEDGNGRSGRLLTNLLLVRLGYPPAIILKQHRSRYLEALSRADKDDDIRSLASIFARAIKHNLDRFIYPSIAGPAKLIPLSALTTATRTLAAMKQAAQRGRLRYHLQNGMYYSTQRWIDEYERKKDTRGRKPKPL